MNSVDYPRNLLGYGADPPMAKWPGNARIAVQFVVNYEEGAENCVLHGDETSEKFLSEIVGASAYKGQRHMNMESLYEYGARAGYWRLHRLLTEYEVPATVFAVGMALERNPSVIESMQTAGWEIASHGYRWIDYQFVEEAVEREHLQRAIDLHEKLTGAKPQGWYLGRCSPNTHRLVAEHGDFLYNADSYADDLPYWDQSFAKPQLMVPYTLDVNDMRFATPQGFNTGRQFFHYLKDTFDELYREGEQRPKMMSIGLHCRLAGRPGRTSAIRCFLEHIRENNNVWLARRSDIAQHWRQYHPLQEEARARR
ncbi:MAG: allantoinase PuuE [Woeseia sp.]